MIHLLQIQKKNPHQQNLQSPSATTTKFVTRTFVAKEANPKMNPKICPSLPQPTALHETGNKSDENTSTSFIQTKSKVGTIH